MQDETNGIPGAPALDHCQNAWLGTDLGEHGDGVLPAPEALLIPAQVFEPFGLSPGQPALTSTRQPPARSLFPPNHAVRRRVGAGFGAVVVVSIAGVHAQTPHAASSPA